METLKIELQSEQEKQVLLAFLDSLHYEYRTETEDYVLNDDEIKEMIKRRDEYFSGKIITRPWSEIKKRYEGV